MGIGLTGLLSCWFSKLAVAGVGARRFSELESISRDFLRRVFSRAGLHVMTTVGKETTDCVF